MIKHTTIELSSQCSSLDWIGNQLIDWTGNRIYFDPQNEGGHFNKYSFGTRFDGVKSMNDGEYVIIFEKLGTKALILKNGEVIREINRSYYCSEVYEYPIEVFKNESGKVHIAHCPNDYNQIEIEDIESGELLTKVKNREPKDVFHSRFEVSPNGKFLLSAGWVWHPFDILTVFDLKRAFNDPTTLDSHELGPSVASEVTSATWTIDSKILISTSDEEPVQDEEENFLPPNHIGIFSLESDSFIKLWKQPMTMGNLISKNDRFAWDLFDHPKVFDLQTGEILAISENINSGKQNSSIIHHHKDLPYHSLSEDGTRLAISNDEKVEILEWIDEA